MTVDDLETVATGQRGSTGASGNICHILIDTRKNTVSVLYALPPQTEVPID